MVSGNSSGLPATEIGFPETHLVLWQWNFGFWTLFLAIVATDLGLHDTQYGLWKLDLVFGKLILISQVTFLNEGMRPEKRIPSENGSWWLGPLKTKFLLSTNGFGFWDTHLGVWTTGPDVVLGHAFRSLDNWTGCGFRTINGTFSYS